MKKIIITIATVVMVAVTFLIVGTKVKAAPPGIELNKAILIKNKPTVDTDWLHGGQSGRNGLYSKVSQLQPLKSYLTSREGSKDKIYLLLNNKDYFNFDFLMDEQKIDITNEFKTANTLNIQVLKNTEYLFVGETNVTPTLTDTDKLAYQKSLIKGISKGETTYIALYILNEKTKTTTKQPTNITTNRPISVLQPMMFPQRNFITQTQPPLKYNYILVPSDFEELINYKNYYANSLIKYYLVFEMAVGEPTLDSVPGWSKIDITNIINTETKPLVLKIEKNTSNLTLADHSLLNTKLKGLELQQQKDIFTQLGNGQLPRFTALRIQQTADTTPPVIVAKTPTIFTDVDNPITIDNLKTNFTITDEADGTIDPSNLRVLSDGYSENKKKLGTYSISFEVKDKSNNIAKTSIAVKVVDLKKPTLTTTKQTYTQSYKTQLQLSDILNTITVTDNYDKNLTATLKNENYTANYNTPGTYQIVYQAIDSSNNKGEITLTINVVDDVKPIIEGLNVYTTEYQTPITLKTIKKGLNVSDEIDKTLSVENLELVKDEYTSNTTQVGKHKVVFTIKDKSNNISNEFTVTVNVIDKTPPIISPKDVFISFDKANKKTIEEIIQFMIDKKQLPSNFLLSNYTIVDVDNYETTNTNDLVADRSFKIQLKPNDSVNEDININVLMAGGGGGGTVDPQTQPQGETKPTKENKQLNNIIKFVEENWLYMVGAVLAIIILSVLISAVRPRRRRR